MAGKSGTNNANGVISLIVLACGITFSSLIGCMIKKAIEKNVDYDENMPHISKSRLESSVSLSTAPLWSFGFAFIIPGIIGVLSAFIKNKGVYITQMVFCIISLLVMGIFFIVAFVGLEYLAVLNPSMDGCHNDMDGRCKCSSFDTAVDYSCEDLKSMYAMGISILLIIVLAWILLLVITVLAGILACRQETQPGTVLRPPVTTTVVQLAPVGGMPPQVTYLPQSHPQVHDQAQLVHNMEY